MSFGDAEIAKIRKSTLVPRFTYGLVMGLFGLNTRSTNVGLKIWSKSHKNFGCEKMN